jgi:hypothetical protein
MRLKNITEEDQNKEVDVNDVNLEAPSRASELSAVEIEDTQIRHLAYSLWEERGSPHGSSEDDWFKAKIAIWRKIESTRCREHLSRDPAMLYGS